jgi:hypothetical protein
MGKLLDEIKLDADFVKSHALQPKWYKALKVFILVGFVAGYGFLSGWVKTGIFLAVFIFLSFLVHMFYRIGTRKWKRSWLDFVVVEEDNEIKARSIGKFYYSAVILNAILALVISQSP